jgi:flagellar motor component MotA
MIKVKTLIIIMGNGVSITQQQQEMNDLKQKIKKLKTTRCKPYDHFIYKYYEFDPDSHVLPRIIR